jgi:hypothetical protein
MQKLFRVRTREEWLQRAARYEQVAARVTDPELADSFKAFAAEARKVATQQH